jgi:hypothetical protein
LTGEEKLAMINDETLFIGNMCGIEHSIILPIPLTSLMYLGTPNGTNQYSFFATSSNKSHLLNLDHQSHLSSMISIDLETSKNQSLDFPLGTQLHPFYSSKSISNSSQSHFEFLCLASHPTVGQTFLLSSYTLKDKFPIESFHHFYHLCFPSEPRAVFAFPTAESNLLWTEHQDYEGHCILQAVKHTIDCLPRRLIEFDGFPSLAQDAQLFAIKVNLQEYFLILSSASTSFSILLKYHYHNGLDNGEGLENTNEATIGLFFHLQQYAIQITNTKAIVYEISNIQWKKLFLWSLKEVAASLPSSSTISHAYMVQSILHLCSHSTIILLNLAQLHQPSSIRATILTIPLEISQLTIVKFEACPLIIRLLSFWETEYLLLDIAEAQTGSFDNASHQLPFHMFRSTTNNNKNSTTTNQLSPPKTKKHIQSLCGFPIYAMNERDCIIGLIVAFADGDVSVVSIHMHKDNQEWHYNLSIMFTNSLSHQNDCIQLISHTSRTLADGEEHFCYCSSFHKNFLFQITVNSSFRQSEVRFLELQGLCYQAFETSIKGNPETAKLVLLALNHPSTSQQQQVRNPSSVSPATFIEAELIIDKNLKYITNDIYLKYPPDTLFVVDKEHHRVITIYWTEDQQQQILDIHQIHTRRKFSFSIENILSAANYSLGDALISNILLFPISYPLTTIVNPAASLVYIVLCDTPEQSEGTWRGSVSIIAMIIDDNDDINPVQVVGIVPWDIDVDLLLNPPLVCLMQDYLVVLCSNYELSVIGWRIGSNEHQKHVTGNSMSLTSSKRNLLMDRIAVTTVSTKVNCYCFFFI